MKTITNIILRTLSPYLSDNSRSGVTWKAEVSLFDWYVFGISVLDIYRKRLVFQVSEPFYDSQFPIK